MSSLSQSLFSFFLYRTKTATLAKENMLKTAIPMTINYTKVHLKITVSYLFGRYCNLRRWDKMFFEQGRTTVVHVAGRYMDRFTSGHCAPRFFLAKLLGCFEHFPYLQGIRLVGSFVYPLLTIGKGKTLVTLCYMSFKYFPYK